MDGWRKRWMDVWIGWKAAPPVTGGRGRPVRPVWTGANERGRPGLEDRSRSLTLTVATACLSLAARYQRACWEVVPQGPPWSGPCLFLSHHISAFFFLTFFFYSPSFVSFLRLISPCIFSTIIESHLSR